MLAAFLLLVARSRLSASSSSASRRGLSREEPLLRLSSATVQLPGPVFEFKGKKRRRRRHRGAEKRAKTPQVTGWTGGAPVPVLDPARTKIGFCVAAESFWAAVGAEFNETLVGAARAGQLPLPLVPKFVSPQHLEESGLASSTPVGDDGDENDDDVTLRVDLRALGVKRKILLKALRRAHRVVDSSCSWSTSRGPQPGAPAGRAARLLVKIADMLPAVGDDGGGADSVRVLPPCRRRLLPRLRPLIVLVLVRAPAAQEALEAGTDADAATTTESASTGKYPTLPSPDDVRYDVEALADVLLPVVLPAIVELIIDVAHLVIFALLAALSPLIRLPQCLALLLTADPKKKKKKKEEEEEEEEEERRGRRRCRRRRRRRRSRRAAAQSVAAPERSRGSGDDCHRCPPLPQADRARLQARPELRAEGAGGAAPRDDRACLTFGPAAAAAAASIVAFRRRGVEAGPRFDLLGLRQRRSASNGGASCWLDRRADLFKFASRFGKVRGAVAEHELDE